MQYFLKLWHVNPLTPNDPYRGRTAPLTSERSSSSSSVGPMVNATDVLQPKRLIVLTLIPPRVWTFPRSPTDAPTSPHDARDPGSERWNYVGEH